MLQIRNNRMAPLTFQSTNVHTIKINSIEVLVIY